MLYILFSTDVFVVNLLIDNVNTIPNSDTNLSYNKSHTRR